MYSNLLTRLLRILPDKQYIQLQFFKNIGHFVDFSNPKSFNEKLQWLKIYDRKPEYTIMVDKYRVKKYVQDRLGEDFIIPTLAAYDSASEIDFDTLPNKFVLKWNHDSGSIVICRDKSKLNRRKAIQRLSNAQSGVQGYWYGREWPYKNVKPKLIAEEYIEPDENGEVLDYKLMCFNGKVRCIFVCSKRNSKDGLHVTFFDLNWNILPFTRNHPAETLPIPKPFSLNQMIEAAEVLSKDLTFARIDFYEVNKKPKFGEITFFPGSGLEPFSPEEWDYTLGSWIDLSNVK